MRKNKIFKVDTTKFKAMELKDNPEFYSRDTDAFLAFTVPDESFEFDKALLYLINIDDGSVITEIETEILGRVNAEYEIPSELMAHYGRWKGQIVFEKNGEKASSAIFEFVIKRFLTDERPPTLNEVESIAKLRQEAKELIEVLEGMTYDNESLVDVLQAKDGELTLDARIRRDVNNLENKKADKDEVSQVSAQLAHKADQSALETEKERISNLVAHAGDTNNNSELLDIRVGYGGEIFSTAGDAVRSVAKEKERILNNDATEIYDDDVFNLIRAYNQSGNYSKWNDWRATDYIKVKKGDVISVTTDVHANYPIVLFYSIDKGLKKVIMSTAPIGEIETVSHTMEQDGYLIAQKTLSDSVNDSSIKINVGKPLYVSSKNISDEVVIQGKADKIDYKSLLPEFVQGGFTNQGVEVEHDYMVRTPVIKILPGTKIMWSKTNGRLSIGYATSENPDFGVRSTQWFTENKLTFEATHSYIRFAIRDGYGQTIEDPLTLDKVKEGSSLSIPSHVMYEYDVDLKVNEMNEKVNDLSRFGYTNTFRTPSLNEGGVVSFIDDDGRNRVYDVLYPLFKRLDVPLGLAIVPRWIESGDLYMSENQLIELAEDEKLVEIMNHTYSHKNLGNLLTEEEIHKEIYLAKKWLLNRGFDVDGFVLPYGSDNHAVRKIVQQYHPSCYDFDGIVRVETFSTIRNELISRTRWGVQENRLELHKGYIDEAISKNGWVVITTHVDNGGYWDEGSLADLEELINYIKSKEVRILKPRDAFQIFGNIFENDSGFKIQSDGKIVGAQLNPKVR